MIAILGHFLHKLSSPAGRHKIRVTGSSRHYWALASFLLLAGAATAFAIGKTSNSLPAPPTIPRATLETQEPPPTGTEPTPPMTSKQKQAIMKSNYEKLKRDADDLVGLAKSLQEEVDKSNENVLSLKVVENAEKIERLARKIKSMAKGD